MIVGGIPVNVDAHSQGWITADQTNSSPKTRKALRSLPVPPCPVRLLHLNGFPKVATKLKPRTLTVPVVRSSSRRRAVFRPFRATPSGRSLSERTIEGLPALHGSIGHRIRFEPSTTIPRDFRQPHLAVACTPARPFRRGPSFAFQLAPLSGRAVGRLRWVELTAGIGVAQCRTPCGNRGNRGLPAQKRIHACANA